MASLVKRGKYYHGVISINGKQVWRSLRTGDPVEAKKSHGTLLMTEVDAWISLSFVRRTEQS